MEYIMYFCSLNYNMGYKKLNSNQVINLLKKSEYNYIENYSFDCRIYNDEGGDIGYFSSKTFDNLIKNNKIKLVGKNELFWSRGYYKLI